MWISIEANIGAGKSTLLRELMKRYSEIINVIGEPLDDWQAMVDESKGNQNILELFYNDIPEYAFSFQMNALKTRIEKNNREKQETKVNIVERSIISDHYIFAKKLKEEGRMNLIEWQVYVAWYKAHRNTVGTLNNIFLIILLRYVVGMLTKVLNKNNTFLIIICSYSVN